MSAVPVPSASHVASHGSLAKSITLPAFCPAYRYQRGAATTASSPSGSAHLSLLPYREFVDSIQYAHVEFSPTSAGFVSKHGHACVTGV